MGQVDITNLIVVAIAIAVAGGLPALFPRMPVPGVVLELVIGAVVGPQVLGLVHPGPVGNFMASLGLAVLFLMAGFETDPRAMQGRPIRNAIIGWLLSAAVALGAGFLLFGVGLAGAPILTALALATTSIGALMPILRDFRLLGPPYGQMVLAAGAIGEGAPVIVLSLVLTGTSRAGLQALIMLAFAVGAFTAIVVVARASHGFLLTLFERSMGSSGQFPVRMAICLLMLLVAFAEQLHIDLVIGAFVAGALVRAALSGPQHEAMAARLDGIGSAFLVPIFYVTSGMRLDVTALFSAPLTLAMVPVFALLMLATRGLPALLLYRNDLSSRQRVALALHLGTQISMVVAITGIAVHRGLMAGSQGSALVGGGILTVILFPAVARNFLQEQPAALGPRAG
jgi:Kef-type K+ transport system membrane component KefB